MENYTNVYGTLNRAELAKSICLDNSIIHSTKAILLGNLPFGADINGVILEIYLRLIARSNPMFIGYSLNFLLIATGTACLQYSS